jgi:hypothetical protein
MSDPLPARSRDILLVGSVPLPDAEAVFRAVGEILGERIARIPDGETGPRLNWIEWQAPVFEQHPAFQSTDQHGTLPDWRNESVGTERKARAWYSFKPDVDPKTVRFGDLGYARAAKESFAIFSRCKQQGIAPAHARFQVCLPTPYNVIDQRIAPQHRLQVEKPYEERLLQELYEICDAIPHAQLAIQWDVAHEVQNLAGGRPHWFDNPEEEIIARLVRIASRIPSDVDLGFHLCYGDFAHKHFLEPEDTGLMTRLSNQLSQRLARSIEWIHIPVPRGRTDQNYFAPLAHLQLRPETRLFLGLVHYSDRIPGAITRMKVARSYVETFGIATECGFGRRDPQTVVELLRLHRDVAELCI